MAKNLKVRKTSDGSIGVQCPRCCEVIQPIENPIFDGADCPECGQVIPVSSLKNYKKALSDAEDCDGHDLGDY